MTSQTKGAISILNVVASDGEERLGKSPATAEHSSQSQVNLPCDCTHALPAACTLSAQKQALSYSKQIQMLSVIDGKIPLIILGTLLYCMELNGLGKAWLGPGQYNEGIRLQAGHFKPLQQVLTLLKAQ